MPFDLVIPPPSSLRAAKRSLQTVSAGTELHRVHSNGFGAGAFNAANRGDARFSPIRDVAGDIIPTIYAAQTFECAVCEIILRCPDTPSIDPATGAKPFQIVAPSDFEHHAHSRVRTTADLQLLDLTVAGQRRIGVNQNALLAGPRSTYPETRAWAAEIHMACPEVQGLYYSSFQWGPQYAVLLFGDRCPDAILAPLSSRPVAAVPCHDEIFDLATSLSIDYADV